jgi:hypothetical protein
MWPLEVLTSIELIMHNLLTFDKLDTKILACPLINNSSGQFLDLFFVHN